MDELHHKDIAYEEGASKKGLYSIMDKIIKAGSKIAINISEKFKFIAKIKRDNKYDKNIETVAGFGYENCCFAASLTASKRTLIRFNDINISNNMFLNELWDNIIETENKSRINISFQLKGFNSTKRGFKRYIQNSILN